MAVFKSEQCWSLAFYDRFDRALPRVLACGACVDACVQAGAVRWPRVHYFQRKRLPKGEANCVHCGTNWSSGRQLDMFGPARGRVE